MKKILIIKHGSLGDIVLALSAFASIRAYYDSSKIYLKPAIRNIIDLEIKHP